MAIRKEDILQAEQDLISAIQKSDIPALDRMLHDDLRFLVPNGQMITKQMDLDSHKRGEMVVETLIPHFEDIQIIGDVATAVVVYDTKGAMLGNPIQGKFRYIRIWKDMHGHPQIIGGACFMLS
jgi:ketosteroid isomerase-like protein